MGSGIIVFSCVPEKSVLGGVLKLRKALGIMRKEDLVKYWNQCLLLFKLNDWEKCLGNRILKYNTLLQLMLFLGREE